jgi:hypothetical protein
MEDLVLANDHGVATDGDRDHVADGRLADERLPARRQRRLKSPQFGRSHPAIDLDPVAGLEDDGSVSSVSEARPHSACEPRALARAHRAGMRNEGDDLVGLVEASVHPDSIDFGL